MAHLFPLSWSEIPQFDPEKYLIYGGLPRGLGALMEEGVLKKYFLVTQDPLPLQKGKVTCLFWKDFLEELWSGDIF